MKRLMIGAALAAAISAATPALAYYNNPSTAINHRQANLEQRIDLGRRSGALTAHEYQRLRYELDNVRRAESYYRADGWLTQHEVRDLQARLNTVSQHVYFQKHDGERRYGSYNYRHSGYRY